MATSKDFEKIWKRYQDDVQSTGKLIVAYCQENGIVYAQFERWYRKRSSSPDTQATLVPVELTEVPEEDTPRTQKTQLLSNRDSMWIRSFTIQFRNGLEILRQSIEQSLRTEEPLSDMERQDYIDKINELKYLNRRLLGMIDTLKETLDSVTASNTRNEKQVKLLTAQIEDLQRMIRNQEERNRRHAKNTFGQKTHKEKKRVDVSRTNGDDTGGKQGRDEEKDDYDGSFWFPVPS